MADYEYMIGESIETLQNIEDILVDYFPPPFSHYIEPYSRYQTATDGLEYGDGFPRCSWVFDYLSEYMWEILESYLTGQSTLVYIRTRDAQGSYANYSAIMHRPKPNEATWEMGGWRNVTLNFTMLVLIPEV